jgi:hypothetical protein
MSVRYVGARYVPIWYHNSLDDTSNWEVNVEYEPLTFVTSLNNHLYISKKTVPDNIGTPADNTEYWLDMGVFSGSYADLQEQIDDINDLIDSLGVKPKKYLLIGDSYGTYTNPDDGLLYSWIDDVIAATGIDGTKLAVGSIGFRPPHDGASSYEEVLQNAIQDETITDLEDYTDIVVCGGANDASGIVYGDITKSTIETGMISFITYAKSKFPNATISIGFIGMLPNTFGKGYYPALEVYRSCTEYDCRYLKNVEFIQQVEYLMNDGVHITPAGYEEFKKYLPRAVIDGYCDVTRPIKAATTDNVLPAATIGSWNLLPPIKIMQHNGNYKISMGRPSLGIALAAGNKVTVDNLTANQETNQYKLFSICRDKSFSIKGGVSTNSEVSIVGDIPVSLYTTSSHTITFMSPLIVIDGIYFLSIPKNQADLLKWSASQYYNEAISLIYIGTFSLEFDVTDYSGENITTF